MFSLNVHINIAPKPVELEFKFLALIFLMIKGRDFIFFLVLYHFLQKFLLWDHETWYTGISVVFLSVCKV